MIALLCALASATAFFLALGTADVWVLAWLAPIPILWLAFGPERAWRVALAALGAYAVGEVGFLWPYYDAMGPLVAIVALGPALVFTAVVMAARRAARRLPVAAAVLIFPALWTGWEVIAATYSPHGTFGSWAYSQVDVPIVIQSASAFGLWVVSFLIALFAASAAIAIRRRIATPLAIGALLVAGNVLFGAWRMRQPEGVTIRVAALALDHDDRTTPDSVAILQAREVRRVAEEGAELIVFPEKTALLPGDRRDVVLAPLVAAVRETGVTVITGFDQTGPERRNAAYAITREGAVQTYTKRHHIPGLEQNYVVGKGAGLLGTGSAMVICKDLDFQRTLREDVLAAERQGGLTLMAAPAWDFRTDAWLHARMAVMRGVEGGYAVVRAAANGLVTISDARGRIHARETSGVQRYSSVIADVPRGTGATLYVRLGDAFAWLAGVLGVCLLLWSALARNARGDTRL